MDFQQFLLLAPSILLGLTLHEFAHAWTAFRLGDPTARDRGRLTLNPIKHLDLIGTIMLFVVHFGWAKPVPVNASYFRNPRRDLLLVSLAGPFSNLLLAIVASLVIRMIWPNGPESVATVGLERISFVMLLMAILINVSLAIFNMLPIPPLDGSRLLEALVPERWLPKYRIFERYSMMALFLLFILSYLFNLSIFGSILIPTVNFFTTLLVGFPLLGR